MEVFQGLHEGHFGNYNVLTTSKISCVHNLHGVHHEKFKKSKKSAHKGMAFYKEWTQVGQFGNWWPVV